VNIIGVDDLSGGVSVHDNVTFIHANLTDPDDQKRVSEQFPVDYVFHFAAYAAEGLSPFIRQYNYMNNTVATAFLVSESIKHDVKRFVFTSSMAVYGSQTTPFDESMDLRPIDPYGVAKYACELDLKVAYEQHGLSYCVLRPHNVYGPGQNIWDPYRNVLGIWMYQTLTKTPMTIYGDGTQKRAFSYVDDILPCIWQAAVNPGAHCEIINVGGIVETELNEAIKNLCQITGHTDRVYLEARHETKNAWSTYQKSVDILGYKETVSIDEGLVRMWGWVNKQPERSRKFWDHYELEKGLYSFWKLKKD
jgi:UDP-glucose 4-epimerase